MKIINCLIVEDSAEEASALNLQLKRLLLCEVTICSDFYSATDTLRTQHFDLILLDMNLGDRNGLDIVKGFASLPPVIILSNYSDYAIQSYDLDIVADYIMKPSTDTRLLRAVNRALDVNFFDNSIRDTDAAFLKTGRKIVRFKYDDIDYVEAYGVYSKIFDNQQVHLVNETISDLSSVLPPTMFRRIHKSYIVNINKITGFDHKYFFVESAKIPIGISYKPQLDSLFRLFDVS